MKNCLLGTLFMNSFSSVSNKRLGSLKIPHENHLLYTRLLFNTQEYLDRKIQQILTL